VVSAPRLLIVADYAYVGDEARWLEALRAASAAARGEPVWVQVRAKTLSGAALEAAAARAREAIAAGVPALLNGDARLAARLGYDGVHWPEEAVPAEAASDGLAVHTAAAHSGADAVVFGAVFAPGSKPGEGVGLEALRAAATAARAATVGVIAIGGVTPERVGDCLAAGADGVAVVSGILGAASPAEAVDAYLASLAAPAAGGATESKGGPR
jgi:thiamine-phosphate pyrophosphorylase